MSLRVVGRLTSALVVASFLASVSFAQFTNGSEKVAEKTAFSTELKGEILDGVKEILSKRAFCPGIDFSTWDSLVEQNKKDIDAAESENAFVSSVNRLIRNFGISHVGLRTPRSAEFRRTGMTTGLGVTAQFENNVLVVRSVAEGSPAEKAGLKVGDRIVSVDGSVPTAQTRLTPEGDAEMKLKVERGSETLDISVKSASYQVVRRDTLSWPEPEIAMIRINSFSRGYDRAEIDKLVSEAQSKGAKSIIIDLRSNGGGAVTNLAHLLGLFIDSETAVGTFVNRSMMDGFLKEKSLTSASVTEIAEWGKQKFRPRTPSIKRFEGTTAVLINRGSASASEIFAAAMKEVRDGLVVGQDSRGAVLASTYGKLPGGYELQYPVSDYVTIKGHRLEGSPVKPTNPVAASRGSEEDAVLINAVQSLRAMNVLFR